MRQTHTEKGREREKSLWRGEYNYCMLELPLRRKLIYTRFISRQAFCFLLLCIAGIKRHQPVGQSQRGREMHIYIVDSAHHNDNICIIVWSCAKETQKTVTAPQRDTEMDISYWKQNYNTAWLVVYWNRTQKHFDTRPAAVVRIYIYTRRDLNRENIVCF